MNFDGDLANEEPSVRLDSLLEGTRSARALQSFGSQWLGAAIIAVVEFCGSAPHLFFASHEQIRYHSAFLELVALEESLSPALALTDPEALEILLNMPLN